MTALQTMKNTAYGMSLRLEGMKRRGEPQEKIDALKVKYDKLTQEIQKAEPKNG